MIADKLRLDGDSLISICVQKGSIDESEKYFKALTDKLTEKYWPELTGYLTKIDAAGQANKCETIEQLQALRFSVTPPDLQHKLVEELDKLEELSDPERYFAFFRLFDVLCGGAFGFVQNILQQRAKVIQSPKKSRIIMP